MIKVFLVEDEFVVRQGIKNNIDWAGHGYEFCGDASDGEMAYPMIKAAKPDIVITDIKMPFMDGIELSRLIKEELPNTEIIILSGYEEFEYAKESIKIGVAQYLTKPISGDDLLKELDILSAKILEKQSVKSISELMSLAEKLKEKPQEQNDDFLSSSVDHSQMDRERFRNFLRTGNSKDTEEFVKMHLDELGPEAFKSIVFRQYMMMDAYFFVSEFVEEIHCDKKEIEAFDISNKSLQTSEGAINYITRIIKKAIVLRENTAGNIHNDVVKEVISFIEKNYADDELSLNTVAEYVGFSPNHLSTVFTKETGNNFIKYLTDYRMNKAKELLKCTSKRSSEISVEVGYKDPHYFSSLFKKTQGVTPTQYRGKGTEEED